MVVLIRQFRPPVNNYVIELPAGLLSPGEKFEDAARRELTWFILTLLVETYSNGRINRPANLF